MGSNTVNIELKSSEYFCFVYTNAFLYFFHFLLVKRLGAHGFTSDNIVHCMGKYL
jgi:hypothetical protein